MKIGNAEDFGAAIRRRRKHLGYTQSEVANACGVGVMFVSQLERGKATAELGRAIAVANMVGIDLLMVERGKHEA